MGLRTRITKILKSNINHLVTYAEDPEKIINNSVDEMEDSYDRAKKKTMSLKNELVSNKRFKEFIDNHIENIQSEVVDLIKQDMDENARNAIRKRRSLDELKRKLEIKINQQKKHIEEIDKKITEIEARILLMKNKRRILIGTSVKARKGEGEEVFQDIDFQEENNIENSCKTISRMEERLQGVIDLSNKYRVKEREFIDNEEKLINEELNHIKLQIKGGKK